MATKSPDKGNSRHEQSALLPHSIQKLRAGRVFATSVGGCARRKCPAHDGYDGEQDTHNWLRRTPSRWRADIGEVARPKSGQSLSLGKVFPEAGAVVVKRSHGIVPQFALFAFMLRNSVRATDLSLVPTENFIEVGRQMEI